MSRKFIIGALFIALFFSQGARVDAEGWEDIWRNLSNGQIIAPGVEMTATAYHANISFIINDGDNFANNFSDTDSIRGRIAGNGIDLKTPGYDQNQFITKDELVQWAIDNNEDFLKAIFGGSPETSFGGSTNTSYNVQQLFSTISLSPESSGQNRSLPFIPVSTKDVILKGQYDFMEIGPDNIKGKGQSGMLTYEQKFGENAANSIGIGIPYRQTKLDDSLNSEYRYASFIPFYKHKWYSDKSLVEWMINLTLNAVYIKSSLFPDGGGYVEYGGGTGVKYSYMVAPSLDINIGLSYQFLKKNIPSDLVPEELTWVSEAINSLPVEHDIVPSIGFIYHAVPDRITLRGDVFRISQLQSGVDSGNKNQTVALAIITAKLGQMTEANLGYKRSFEIENLTDQSIIASLRFGWK